MADDSMNCKGIGTAGAMGALFPTMLKPLGKNILSPPQ